MNCFAAVEIVIPPTATSWKRPLAETAVPLAVMNPAGPIPADAATETDEALLTVRAMSDTVILISLTAASR